MAELTEFFAYRETIMEAIAGDEMLLRAIGNPGENALADPTPDVDTLLYQQIYPYKRNDDLIENQTKNFLMFELAASGIGKDGFYNDVSITFYCMTHQNMDRIIKGDSKVLRMDYIMHRLTVLFKEKRHFGIGKLNFGTIRPLICPLNFLGEAMIYSTVDFG